jgi:hypothetical protein
VNEAAAMDSTQPIAKGPEKFGDFNFLSKFVAFSFALLAFLAAMEALLDITAVRLMGREHGLAEAHPSEALAEFVSLVRTVFFFIAAAVFCWWVYLANKNVRALGALDLFAKPGMAVAYFFIPVICFWMPFQAMKQLWQASNKPTAWKTVEVGQLLPIWWTLWVVSGFVVRIISAAVNHEKTRDQIRIVCSLDFARLIIYSAWCVTTLILVLRIRAAQARVVAEVVARSGPPTLMPCFKQ